ncbi:hypothetical protein ACT4US_11910, partial [Bacillus sp. HC-Mk]
MLHDNPSNNGFSPYDLDNGKLYSYEGNYSTFLEAKALREEQELAQESKRQNLYR